MGIFDKLMFWRKEDEFDFDKVAGKELHNAGFPQDNLGIEQKSAWLTEKSPFEDQAPATAPPIGQKFNPSPYQAPASSTGGTNKDLDLINSKLDTVRAMLQSMDQRMANIERNVGAEEKQKQRLW